MDMYMLKNKSRLRTSKRSPLDLERADIEDVKWRKLLLSKL